MPLIEIETDLSDRQIGKFKKLLKGIKLVNGKAYFPTEEMHGVLLTNSRQTALNIVKAHLKFVQIYLSNIEDNQYIKHIGIDVLLEQLSEENPKRKIQYLAARAYISAYLANDPNIFKDAKLRGEELDRGRIRAVQALKRLATHCALTGIAFRDGIDCHIHHVEGASENPDLASDPKNLLPLCEIAHREYHEWANFHKVAVTRATLKQFAAERNYNRNWDS